ncbi:TPA: O-antigen ligase family protein [Yersinia enterocolitica]|nr:O-antigen ligase family protein [Yersinia enterocolitica]
MHNSKEQFLFRLLIVLTPFHYFLFTILLKDYSFLKYWKEVTILLLCVIILIKNLSKITLIDRTFNLTLVDITILYFLIPVFFSFFFLTDSKSDGLYMLRVYLQPILVFYIAKNIRISEKQYNSLIKIIFATAMVLSAYGVFQALILGDQFLINLGYGTKYEGRLLDSYYISGFGNFQRVVSTFVNTNVCALYLCFSLLLVFINSNLFSKRYFTFGVLLILFAILFTFSRSTWIPLFIVLIIIMKYLNKTFPAIRRILLILPVFMLFFLSIFSSILNLRIFEKLYLFLLNSITLKDTSVAGRTGIWNEAIEIAKNNIFGIGMGYTGAKAGVLGKGDIIASESSYLTIMLDFGIQGLISFFLIFIILLYTSLRNINYYRIYTKIKMLNLGIILATITIFTSMFFSNYIHDIELMTIYFTIIGLGLNRYLYNSIINK